MGFNFPKWRGDAPYLAFLPEWGCVAVAAVGDLLLLTHTSMRFHVDSANGCLLLFPLTAIAILLRKLDCKRAADTLECLAVMSAGSLVMCVATYIGWAMPAMGALPFNGLKGAYPFVEKARLHAGGALDFSLDHLTGVVTFPSFHVVMILGFSYAFRGTGIVGWLILAANLVTLFGVPVFGGHFLADLIGGAAVFAVTVAIVRFALFETMAKHLAGFVQRLWAQQLIWRERATQN